MPHAPLFPPGWRWSPSGRVREQPHFCVDHIVPAHCRLQRMQYTCGEITGRGQYFRHADASAGFFDNGNVSEGAADIDAEPPNHAPCSPLRRSYCTLTLTL